jgi:hypothetical protein
MRRFRNFNLSEILVRGIEDLLLVRDDPDEH